MNSQTPAGMVTGHNLMSFIEDLSLQDLDDLTDCTRIATASADMGHNRFTNSQLWFEEYANTLDFLGWSLHEGAITTRTRTDVSGTVADYLVKSAQSMQNRQQGNAMIDTLDALKPNQPATLSLDRESLHGRRFQIIPASYGAQNNLSIAVFHLELTVQIERTGFLFWEWEDNLTKLVQQRAVFTLNRTKLEDRRQLLDKKIREITLSRFALNRQ